MAADPKFSAGARMERKAVLAKLRRDSKVATYVNVNNLIDWVKRRQKRYDKAVGGLGRK